MRLSIQLAIVCGLVLFSTQLASARTWTDSSGKHTIEAELVEFKDGVVKLKRADGREVSLPIDKLSDADQQFLRSPKTGDDPWNAIVKGAEVEVNVAGKWVLAVVDEIDETSVGIRYVVTLDDSKQQRRVTEKRIRAVGATTAAGGSAKPRGERVEVRRGSDWLPATLLSSERNTAMVQIDGETTPRRTLLAMIRRPGGESMPRESRQADSTEVDMNSIQLQGLKQSIAMMREMGAEIPPEMLDQVRQLEGKVAGGGSAGAGRTPMPEKQTPQFPVVEPAETTMVSMAGVRFLSPSAAAAPASAASLVSLGRDEAASLSRSSPVTLFPKRDIFDKVKSYSVAVSGQYVAVLRSGFSGKGAVVEIVSTTNNEPSTLIGLPEGTEKVFLSPEGSKVLTLRSQHMSFDSTFDLWSLGQGKLTPIASWKIGADTTGIAGRRGRRSMGGGERIDDVYWVSDDLFVTDTRTQIVQWRASDQQPQWQMQFSSHRSRFGPGGRYVLTNDSNFGVVVVDLATGEVKSVLAKGQAMAGSVSLSPSRGGLLVSGGSGFQLWDLVNRKLVVWAASPPGSSGRAEWTVDEGVIAFGSKPIDVHTMSPAASAVFNEGNTVAGYRWSVSDPQGKGTMMLSFAPVAQAETPSTPVAPTLASNLPTYLSPGGGVAIDVQVDSEIQQEVLSDLEAAVTGRGFKIDNSSPVRLVATTELGKQQSNDYTSFFGRDEAITVTWNPRVYVLTLSVNGTEYWTRRASQNFNPPSTIRISASQTAQQFVDENLVWEAHRMPRAVLPDYIFPMGN